MAAPYAWITDIERQSAKRKQGRLRMISPQHSIMHLVPLDRPQNDARNRRGCKLNANDFNPPSVYGAYPPPVPCSPAIRLDPLHPPTSNQGLSNSLETDDVHMHNHLRRDIMLRREYDRFHNHWRRYYYGDPYEKEIYRRYMREGLKEQMSNAQKRKKEELKEHNKESIMAAQRDRLDKENDAQVTTERMKRMEIYRELNKKMMDERTKRMKTERFQEQEFERRQMEKDWLNWNRSLY